jgi:hypothetical protein
MWHALSFELVIRLMLEHGCTVLYSLERMGVCSSWYRVYPCSTRVAGPREFRGTRAHASTLPRLPKLRRVKHDRDRLGARQEVNIAIRSCLFFFSTSERNDYYCYHILCCHYYEISKWELLFCQFSIRRLDHSLLLLQSNSFLNRTTRMYNVLEAQPFRIDWARSGVDEHIIQNTSERTSTERCHHRDPISN